MEDSVVSAHSSEDLLADFETLLKSGSIDLSADHQIVIISPACGSVELLQPRSAGTDLLLFSTPHSTTPTPPQQHRDTTTGRPPVLFTRTHSHRRSSTLTGLTDITADPYSHTHAHLPTFLLAFFDCVLCVCMHVRVCVGEEEVGFGQWSPVHQHYQTTSTMSCSSCYTWTS